MTTTDEIVATLNRIERKQDAQGDRLDKLERFADRTEGALTLVKFVASFLGLGGVATILVVLAQSAKP